MNIAESRIDFGESIRRSNEKGVQKLSPESILEEAPIHTEDAYLG